jgi:Arc/MetJ-type ribon-helix-helix transcriptional regulator
MDQPRDDHIHAEAQMVELYTELPESVAGWIADAASRFHVSRSEIIRRAVEHFLGHVEEVRVAIEQRERSSELPLDWGQAKRTMEQAHCPYGDCPFAGDCPVDVCPL